MTNSSPLIPSVGILADDLTSAADGGAPFGEKGLEIRIIRKGIRQETGSAEVVSIDCATRSLDEAAAIKATTLATRSIAGARVLYKTIDSTLRGHIRAEIGAAFLASGRNRLVVAPAFPDAGRITRNGVQFVHGLPVCQSNYAQDPVHPIQSSNISDCIPSDILNVIILDAETQQDLNDQVTALGEIETTLWVGSPGMAKALASQLPHKLGAERQAPVSKSVLVVVGSANPMSTLQARRLRDDPRAVCLSVPNERAVDPRRVVSDLISKAIQQCSQCDTVIATGGDTMEAFLDRLDVYEFVLAGEIEPGFPLATARLSNGAPITLAMKAGGFGDENTLRRAVDHLCSRSSSN
ncbi:four-carbon acid sugar kinase family protein [Parasedimentitalea huanghaiensis]|uniref:Four-carbon acid sugar kinase family protein n=1 Tax=Parasedimentitalea huanghaiensis TaxID=2682100 RepID=A0A6L6WHB2_9RHOB|nr:four-carbon acid sugar kinase family protein [Zongyanglinia huanghaiensis]MVO17094.1 four-carbon acid sugar kinase family protein [Zongyanglinia huanghaiensis]